jgi:general secretion pathway protein C
VRPAFTLFGLAAKNPRASGCNHLNQVPVSSLKLRLTGLLASSNPARSIAIIEKGNQQVSLSVGDTTPGYDARIVAILPDRIIVNYQGRKRPFYYLTIPARRRHRPPPRPSALVKRLREQPQNILTYLIFRRYSAATNCRDIDLIQAKTLAVSPVRPAGK